MAFSASQRGEFRVSQFVNKRTLPTGNPISVRTRCSGDSFGAYLLPKSHLRIPLPIRRHHRFSQRARRMVNPRRVDHPVLFQCNLPGHDVRFAKLGKRESRHRAHALTHSDLPISRTRSCDRDIVPGVRRTGFGTQPHGQSVRDGAESPGLFAVATTMIPS